jgi:Ca-activated chloride channel homolog
MKMLVLGSVALIVLGACSCENNTPDPAAALAPPPPQDVAAVEPTPAPAPDPSRPPVDGEATLTAPESVIAGSNIDVAWTGPGNSADYIDIVPRGQKDTGTQSTYGYVGPSKGSVTLRAPTTAGDYDLRYILDMAGKKTVKATAPLAVTGAVATLVAPATAETGQSLAIAWTGPNGAGDYIDIVKGGQTATGTQVTYVYTNAGTPAKLEAPSSPGVYDIRYVLEGPGGRKVPATSKLAVTLAKATLDAAPTAAREAKIRVQWTGPNSSGDYIDLVKRGSTATSGEASYFYTANNGELTAPKEAGDYDIRYVLDAPGGRAILARRPISIR